MTLKSGKQSKNKMKKIKNKIMKVSIKIIIFRMNSLVKSQGQF